MAIAVKDTGKWNLIRKKYSVSDDIETCSRVSGKVDIGHLLEMLIPVVLVRANGIHLVCIVNEIWIIRLSGTAAVFGHGWQATIADNKQNSDFLQQI